VHTLTSNPSVGLLRLARPDVVQWSHPPRMLPHLLLNARGDQVCCSMQAIVLVALGLSVFTTAEVAQVGKHMCDGYDTEWAACPALPPCRRCKPVDCQFGDWGDWYGKGQCLGVRFRRRGVLASNNACGRPCNGTKIQSQAYNSPSCAANMRPCNFSAWTDWSSCPSAYDQRMRTRVVFQDSRGSQHPCNGSVKETIPCKPGPEPLPCQLSAWEVWTSCSTSCGGGRHTRMRHIQQAARFGGSGCNSTLLETQPCRTTPCPPRNCTLNSWSSWSSCKNQQPQRYRERSINQSSSGDGGQCSASLRETCGCSVPGPPSCRFSQWTDWSKCNKDCGGGQQRRSRHLSGSLHTGNCSRTPLGQIRPCNLQHCRSDSPSGDCVLSDWMPWAVCSVSCGNGSTTRKRSLSPAKGDGKGCGGAVQEMGDCTARPCPVIDCGWSEWSAWSTCTASCGGGMQSRHRRVAVRPSPGGAPCTPRSKSEITECATQSCTTCTDGTWGAWMQWTSCSATCASGFQSRRRDIEQEANNCGRPAQGLREEYKACSSLPPCIPNKDCQLAPWGDWSYCSCTCFGVRERNRFVKVFASGNGTQCVSMPLKEVEPCNPGPNEEAPRHCGGDHPRNCVLDDWSDWSRCSEHCGGGQTQRSRKIRRPATQGGKPCDSNTTVIAPCNINPCRITKCKDCMMGQWSEWSSCSTCNGQKFRHRSIMTMPNFCGKPCDVLSSKEVSNCTGHCDRSVYCAWTSWSDAGSCDVGCGSSTAMRNRALTLMSKATSFFFQTADTTKCAGTQLNQTVCPVRRSCQPPCQPIDCKFGSWSDWEEPSCEGLCQRHRTIAKVNNECGVPCAGAVLSTKRCNTTCWLPKDCVLSDWQSWSACGNSSYNTQKYRNRKVKQEPTNGGKPCTGILAETGACKAILSDPCVMSTWSDWGTCQASCGSGWQQRARHVVKPARGRGAACAGSLKELQACSTTCVADPIPCTFSDWSHWSGCSADGQRFRRRTVAQPAAAGGKPCDGTLQETHACGPTPVDCKFSDWTDWGTCDQSCGSGQTHRQRQIHQFPGNGGRLCPSQLIQTKGCAQQKCIFVDCKVGTWSDWGSCSVTCGSGQQARNRNITGLRDPGGSGCNMPLAEARECIDARYGVPPSCNTTDCRWDDWSDWSGCTCSCGGGQRTRSRQIAQVPEVGGLRCNPKNREEVMACNTISCDLTNCQDGKWGPWADWYVCSATCGGGETFRYRLISQMASRCGKPPTGKDRETKFCNRDVPCSKPQDCLLTAWSEWTGCSATCDGVKRRTRRIGQYGRGSGKFCIGALKETWPCNPSPGEEVPMDCHRGQAINCRLSDWKDWTACSAKCGTGQRMRERDVVQYASGGGRNCDASLSEIRDCTQFCPNGMTLDCKFSDWLDWGACDRCGGQMYRYRHIVHYPQHGGRLCRPMDVKQVATCPTPCHQLKYCSWADWNDWGDCTAKCGSGRRQRRRLLQLTTKPDDSIAAMAKYEELASLAQQVEASHMQELIAAFAAGCISFVAVFTAMKGCPNVSQESGRRLANPARFSWRGWFGSPRICTTPRRGDAETDFLLISEDYNSDGAE